jgi:hypothetical protein
MDIRRRMHSNQAMRMSHQIRMRCLWHSPKFVWYCLIWMTSMSPLQQNCSAQQSDFWTLQSLDVTYKLSRVYQLSIGAQSMFNQNSTSAKLINGDVSLIVKFPSNMQLEGHYRPIQARDNKGGWTHRNMFFGTLSWNEQIGKYTIQVRERIQRLTYGDLFEQSNREPKLYNRSKIGVRYQHNYYWSLLFNTELFVPFNGARQYRMDQIRTAAGLGRRFNRSWRAECVYGVMQQLNRSRNNNNYFLSLSVHYFI